MSDKLTFDDFRARIGDTRQREYWRSLDELSRSADFESVLANEFPQQALPLQRGSVDRRGRFKPTPEPGAAGPPPPGRPPPARRRAARHARFKQPRPVPAAAARPPRGSRPAATEAEMVFMRSRRS